MKLVDTAQAPTAIGPYSQAIAHSGFLFVSGQLPIDPATGEITGTNSAEQIEQCLKNIAAIAKEVGIDLSRTVKTTVLVTNLGEFGAVNEVYGKHFSAPFPARACYQVVALPKGALVEVEAILALD